MTIIKLMSNELKHKIFSSTNCLSEQTMFDYIDNKLTPKEQHRVEKHLLSCELCTDAMEGLQLLKNRNRINLLNEKINQLIVPAISEERKIISINYKLISSIAAGLLLLVGGVFFFNNFFTEQMKENDVAELKQPLMPPTISPVDNPTAADSEATITVTGKEEEGKPETEKTEQQNQLAFAKEEKQSPDYKTTVVTTEKELDNNLKQVVVTKTDEDKKVIDIPAQTGNTKIVLAETRKNVGDESKEQSKDGNGTLGGYATTAQPTTPSKQNEYDTDNAGVAGGSGSKNTGNKNIETNNRFKHEATLGKKEKAQKGEERQTAVAGNTTSAPQSVTAAYEEKAEVVVISPAESTIMADSLSAQIIPSAIFPGGVDSLNRFVIRNFNYPSAYYSRNTKGSDNKIISEFTIDESGKVVGPKIIKGINSELDNEALRVISSLPKWLPAIKNGKPISSKYILPIQLDNGINSKQVKEK